MIEFGKTLREAREGKGYSISQLAEITHILPQIIENLEKEDFTRIIAPIYGRGFVKLYCEAVGIDAKPLVNEFMEIFNGNRQPSIRLMEVESAEEPKPADEEVAAEAPRVEVAAEISQPEFAATEPEAEEPPPVTSAPLSNPLFAEAEPPSRDYRLPGYSMSDVPKSFWRFGVLVIAAIAIVALLAIGTRALYRATMMLPDDQESEQATTPTASQHDDTAPRAETKDSSKKNSTHRAPRKCVKVPPLYLD